MALFIIMFVLTFESLLAGSPRENSVITMVLIDVLL